VIEGVDRTPLGQLDKGIERERRVPLCMRHPWCIEADGHAGTCTLKTGNTLHEPPDYDPRGKRTT